MLNPQTKTNYLALLKQNPALSNIQALRTVGLTGSSLELKAAHLTPELLEESRIARGWQPELVESVLWKVALDDEHRSWFKAAEMVLRGYEPERWQARQAVSVDVQVDAGSLMSSLEEIQERKRLLMQRFPELVEGSVVDEVDLGPAAA